jgi:hypothetical protein
MTIICQKLEVTIGDSHDVGCGYLKQTYKYHEMLSINSNEALNVELNQYGSLKNDI